MQKNFRGAGFSYQTPAGQSQFRGRQGVQGRRRGGAGAPVQVNDLGGTLHLDQGTGGRLDDDQKHYYKGSSHPSSVKIGPPRSVHTYRSKEKVHSEFLNPALPI